MMSDWYDIAPKHPSYSHLVIAQQAIIGVDCWDSGDMITLSDDHISISGKPNSQTPTTPKCFCSHSVNPTLSERIYWRTENNHRGLPQ
jgi:hypothetical protein